MHIFSVFVAVAAFKKQGFKVVAENKPRGDGLTPLALSVALLKNDSAYVKGAGLKYIFNKTDDFEVTPEASLATAQFAFEAALAKHIWSAVGAMKKTKSVVVAESYLI